MAVFSSNRFDTPILCLDLGAPSHAAAPDMLAKRLPHLEKQLQRFYLSKLDVLPAPTLQNLTVQVYAANLGLQKDHVTLENFPGLSETERKGLQGIAGALAQDLENNCIFTAHGSQDGSLGSLNLGHALPNPAMYIGRNVASALPKGASAKLLRQLQNDSQMYFHAKPFALIQGSVNSLWFANGHEVSFLGQTWLKAGAVAWWDALVPWDLECELGKANLCATLVFSDAQLKLELKRKSKWQFWREGVSLVAVLEQAQAFMP